MRWTLLCIRNIRPHDTVPDIGWELLYYEFKDGRMSTVASEIKISSTLSIILRAEILPDHKSGKPKCSFLFIHVGGLLPTEDTHVHTQNVKFQRHFPKP